MFNRSMAQYIAPTANWSTLTGMTLLPANATEISGLLKIGMLPLTTASVGQANAVQCRTAVNTGRLRDVHHIPTNRRDSEWLLCDDVQPPCLVFSVGIGNLWQFDLAAAERGCEVHSFDPTPELHSKHLRNVHEYRRAHRNINFHYLGLGATRANITSSYGKTGLGPVAHLDELIRTYAGGRMVDVLKVDLSESPQRTERLHNELQPWCPLLPTANLLCVPSLPTWTATTVLTPPFPQHPLSGVRRQIDCEGCEWEAMRYLATSAPQTLCAVRRMIQFELHVVPELRFQVSQPASQPASRSISPPASQSRAYSLLPVSQSASFSQSLSHSASSHDPQCVSTHDRHLHIIGVSDAHACKADALFSSRFMTCNVLTCHVAPEPLRPVDHPGSPQPSPLPADQHPGVCIHRQGRSGRQGDGPSRGRPGSSRHLGMLQPALCQAAASASPPPSRSVQELERELGAGRASLQCRPSVTVCFLQRCLLTPKRIPFFPCSSRRSIASRAQILGKRRLRAALALTVVAGRSPALSRPIWPPYLLTTLLTRWLQRVDSYSRKAGAGGLRRNPTERSDPV